MDKNIFLPTRDRVIRTLKTTVTGMVHAEIEGTDESNVKYLCDVTSIDANAWMDGSVVFAFESTDKIDSLKRPNRRDTSPCKKYQVTSLTRRSRFLSKFSVSILKRL